MTVDRKNRDASVAAINRYLDGQSTAMQSDDEIFSRKGTTAPQENRQRLRGATCLTGSPSNSFASPFAFSGMAYLYQLPKSIVAPSAVSFQPSFSLTK